jgi:predicted secreted hydrolase
MNARLIVLLVLAALASLAARAAFAEGADKGFAGLGSDAAGFDIPVPGTPLVFPRDLGPHPGFRTEWWYLTANLQDESGVAYGVQWTLFRQAGAPRDEREGWANGTVWMGHAAVTTATEHLFSETFARGGVGQAGVIAQPFRAWIDDWVFEASPQAPGKPAHAV